MRRATALVISLTLVMIATACEAPPSQAPSVTESSREVLLASGRYGPGSLDLTFDPDSLTVTGFYESHTGWDERLGVSRFSCEFFLEGRWDGGTAEIQTWYPGSENRIGGLLKVWADDQFEISLDEEHGGCENVEPDFDKGGVSFRLEAARPGKAIAVIASEQAFFHDQPTEDRRGDSHVARGDAVYLLETVPGWVRGAFRETEAWLKESDFYADTIAVSSPPK